MSEPCTPLHYIYILTTLAKGLRFGLDLVHESGGLLKRGTVYVELSRLSDLGFVERYKVPHDVRHKFRITPKGCIELEKHHDKPS